MNGYHALHVSLAPTRCRDAGAIYVSIYRLQRVTLGTDLPPQILLTRSTRLPPRRRGRGAPVGGVGLGMELGLGLGLGFESGLGLGPQASPRRRGRGAPRALCRQLGARSRRLRLGPGARLCEQISLELALRRQLGAQLLALRLRLAPHLVKVKV